MGTVLLRDASDGRTIRVDARDSGSERIVVHKVLAIGSQTRRRVDVGRPRASLP